MRGDATHYPHTHSQPHHQQQLYASPTEYTQGSVNLHQTPQSAHLSSPASTTGVPSALQPGGSQPRPGPSAAYTAPTTIPTMPQINTNAQQYTLPTRSNTMSQSQHNYSRSDSSGVEQKYIPFSASAEKPPQYPPTPNQKFYSSYSPATPGGAPAQSPLVLEHIRPRTNSNLDDQAGVSAWNEERQPTNSNYLAPWAAFAYDWCKWPIIGHGNNTAGKMAIGSYLEDPHNFIQILDTKLTTSDADPQPSLEYTRIAEATCSYPVTRILWEPPSSQKQSTDLLATSGDHLRLWSLPQTTSNPVSSNISNKRVADTPQKLTPLALLSNSKTPEHTAPLTSLDWNTISPKLIITSSIDTTCTIWDIPTLTAKTQLIAHDKEVFDVRFLAGSVDIFGSCGADGSVRMFDLRSLEHSTIIYEPAEKSPSDREKTGSPNPPSSPSKSALTTPPPLLRLAASPHDFHLLATFAADSNIIRVLDVRQPGQALLELRGHGAALNCLDWSPSRRGMLASGADDSLVCIWDLFNASNGAQMDVHISDTMTSNNGAPVGTQATGPAASWRCEYEVSNLSWAPQSGLTAQGGEWVGVCGGRGIWGVKL
ncbi:WD40 repeat-like protein [Rhizodiscina lignyota]|uniref:WD40 repeat-like protein n=1 Tax=Rhizodiscina lignyota TaxID=1504668 RepID=A0A9P4IQ76_9PEZI|nr:WD40 repeat-like protein [Rhizodiscina lignyota]